MKRTPGQARGRAAAALQFLIDEWEDSAVLDDDDYTQRPPPSYGSVYQPEKPGAAPLTDGWTPPGRDKVPLMRARVAAGYQPCHPNEAPQLDDGSALRAADVIAHLRNGRDVVVEFLTDAAARDYADGIAAPVEPMEEILADAYAVRHSLRGGGA